MDWYRAPTYLQGIINKIDVLSQPVKIAAFDLDETLIHRNIHKPQNDWTLLSSRLPNIIKQLVRENYIIICFTNQSGMNNNRNFREDKWQQNVETLTKQLFSKLTDYYFAIYAAADFDRYRKPNIGMWQLMTRNLKHQFCDIIIDDHSFFCGDAAGRSESGYYHTKFGRKRGDFSDVDRKFALNIGIRFETPETFYRHELHQPYHLTGIDPAMVLREASRNGYHFEPRKRELIIMVAAPGSGKTEFVCRYILPHGYVHVNADTCGTRAKCISIARRALQNGENVVVDNTNPDVASRNIYMSLAHEYGYRHIRAIVMTASVDLAKHLNNVRNVYSHGKIPRVSKIVYNIYNKKYIDPKKREGFDKIEYVDFSFYKDNLDNAKWRQIFMRYSES